jgi:hypothetical protein
MVRAEGGGMSVSIETITRPRARDPEILLHDIIADLLSDHDGDAEAAAEDLESLALSDRSIRSQVQNQTLAYMCREAVAEVLRKRRSIVLNGGGHTGADTHRCPAPATFSSDGHTLSDSQSGCAVAPSQNGERLMAAVQYRNLLDTITLPVTHKPLSKATREELAEAVRYYDRRASAYQQRYRIFAAILDRVPEGKKPSEVLTDEALREILND